mmetsp:Transcript_70770/g.224031  ORF Transcript_70770/g.224031 Transcript_70770/m.224031 type:complete len:212 (+) Transcript_70770:379-1014(+)
MVSWLLRGRSDGPWELRPHPLLSQRIRIVLLGASSDAPQGRQQLLGCGRRRGPLWELHICPPLLPCQLPLLPLIVSRKLCLLLRSLYKLLVAVLGLFLYFLDHGPELLPVEGLKPLPWVAQQQGLHVLVTRSDRIPPCHGCPLDLGVHLDVHAHEQPLHLLSQLPQLIVVKLDQKALGKQLLLPMPPLDAVVELGCDGDHVQILLIELQLL